MSLIKKKATFSAKSCKNQHPYRTTVKTRGSVFSQMTEISINGGGKC